MCVARPKEKSQRSAWGREEGNGKATYPWDINWHLSNSGRRKRGREREVERVAGLVGAWHSAHAKVNTAVFALVQQATTAGRQAGSSLPSPPASTCCLAPCSPSTPSLLSLSLRPARPPSRLFPVPHSMRNWVARLKKCCMPRSTHFLRPIPLPPPFPGSCNLTKTI